MNLLKEQVREAYQKRNLPEELMPFDAVSVHSARTVEPFDEEAFGDYMQDVNGYCMVSDDLGVRHPGLKGVIKRLMIKLIRFYILPIVEKQNLYNVTVRSAMNQFDAYVAYCEARMECYEKQIERLENEISVLRGKTQTERESL